MTIEELDLSVRSFNCLKRAGINTVEDLINTSQEDMMKLRNLGRKSLEAGHRQAGGYGPASCKVREVIFATSPTASSEAASETA